MRRAFFVIVLAFAALIARAQAPCLAKVQLNTDKTVTVSSGCASAPKIAKDETFTISVGDKTVSAIAVVSGGSPAVGGVVIQTGPVSEPDVLTLGNATTGKINDGEASFDAQFVTKINPRNSFKYDWSVGPATKGDEDGETDDSSEGDEPAMQQEDEDPPADDAGDSTGAIRFRYSGEYARGGFFGQGGQGRGKLLQTTANLLIDTTDQDDPNFIDNNKLALGVQATGLGFGRLWMHGTAGIEAKVEKAFHHENRNADMVAKVSGWVPVARSITLFPKNGIFIAAPLSFTASYGYRNKNKDNVESQGRVFEATALYHLFLMDQFQIDLSATLTHSDLGDIPAGTPKTQRMYKATISYLTDPAKGFKVLTSIENGSFGVMLKEVRQYFVGVAISKLNFGSADASN
jgi:hypothetical protein